MMTPPQIDEFLSALGLTGPAATLDGLLAMPRATPDRLQWAYGTAGVVLDDVQALEASVMMAEQLDSARIRLRDRSDMAGIPGDRIFAGVLGLVDATEGLQVADSLTGLPFLDLAAEIACLQPAGRLTIRSGTAGTGCNGLYSRSRIGGVIILASEPTGASLEDVFAHELAHAVDPELTTVDSVGREAFAEHLGPAIVRQRPSDLSELAPLIAAALEATRGRRRPASASMDLEQLVTFVAIEVGALAADTAVDLIAAHAHRGDP